MRRYPCPGARSRAEALKQYLEWWDATLAPVLRGRAIFVLLCTPIEARKPNKFSEKLAQVFSGKTLRLNETYGYVLGELGHVSVDDLHHLRGYAQHPDAGEKEAGRVVQEAD